MPKKTKKMKQRAASRREMLGAAMPADSAMHGAARGNPARIEPATSARSAFSTRASAAPLTYDYSHIYADLKRIAFFAAFFFAALIALSFVIK